MTTKKWAVSDGAQEIALKYGRNVSQGILAMEKKIQEQAKEISDMGAWIEERV
jgi:hypothetical protein